MAPHAKFAIGLALPWLAMLGTGCSRTGLLNEDPYESTDWPSSCSAKALRLRVMEEPPNLYFVLDRSGSMAEAMPGGSANKFTAVREAALSLVRKLGSHVNVGAAVFPAQGRLCQPGEQVFETIRGDVAPRVGDADGPITAAFAEATKVTTLGYTPTAATLRALLPTLSALRGRTAVVLATDGGPNCNSDARCTANECISNIQQVAGCDSAVNCCAPSAGPDAPRMCLDKEPTLEAVRALKQAKINTYVVGIPGSQPFTDLLGQAAIEGGTGRSGDPSYYAVNDIDALASALEQISRDFVTCDLALDEMPLDRKEIKVFLDGEEVGLDHTDGYSWTGEKTFKLMGPSCAAFLQGKIKHVEAYAFCDDGMPRKP